MTTRRTQKQPQINSHQAAMLFRRLKQHGLGDAQFHGLTEQEIIRAIKRTRHAIWQEKLAARP